MTLAVRWGVIGLAAMIPLLLAGCHSTKDDAGQSAASSFPSSSAVAPAPQSTYDGAVPNFTGPWAAELAQAYRSTSSSVVHQILATGTVSDRDYATVSSSYVTCMANKGFKAHVDGPLGQTSVTGKGDAIGANTVCGADLSALGSVRYYLLRNPQHLDEGQIMAACLVKKKVAPPTYTAKQYDKDAETQKFPFNSDSANFLDCVRDPLGVMSGK